MNGRANPKIVLAMTVLLLVSATSTTVCGQDWKNQIVFPDDSFRTEGVFDDAPGWVKFTIKLNDPNTVYFQDSQLYIFHYDFATAVLPPFIGMSPTEYHQITLYEQGQEAVLGTVILPPIINEPPVPAFLEYGIQFVRYDPYSREEIRDMFSVVKANILADPNVQAFYFPTYEQLAIAEANRDWFAAQGIPVSSTARWAEGNACYAEGWALGELKFFPGDQIEAAYLSGNLLPGDILLTDGVPAEIPFVAGILSLLPSTPNSHVAILARTFGVPFAHLALAEDANQAQQLIGHKVVLRASDDVKLIDVEGVLDETTITEILALKELPELNIQPTALYGSYSADTNDLVPADIQYFGGKAANFGILRNEIPDNCPVAVAFSFDLWNEFLDQTIVPRDSVTIDVNGFELFWADKDLEQGSNHADFKLNDEGEYIGLCDTDGTTLIDSFSFGLQTADVSYGRCIDGGDSWQFFASGSATPGQENSPGSSSGSGLVINEFMAENDWFVQDNFGEYDDWLELYNASGAAIDLGGMYLTDDLDEPTKWMIPPAVTSSTLREEIANRLSGYTYPPSDMAALSEELSAIRSLFKNAYITSFTQAQKDAVIGILQDPNYGFDISKKIRFRSSTNVEDSNQFTGAGLYDSYSGCLADDLDGDDLGPCICDPNKASERGVFRAIRKVFASFYNDNAFLERLRHDVNEGDVGMALLVHHSFPDEIELANGVATLEQEYSEYSPDIRLVSQLGATSVANPEDGSVPEEVSVNVYSSGEIGSLKLIRSSNLVPLGAKVMQWQDDYIELSELLLAAAEPFVQVSDTNDYILDFEYKKLAPGGAAMPGGGLVVKQIREIPQPDETRSITPFLFNDPVKYCIFQGEFGGSVFGNHRLKSRWTLETRNLWLNEANLSESFYADAHIEYAAAGRIRNLTGKLPLWPEAWHSVVQIPVSKPYNFHIYDGWLMHHLQNPRAHELRTDNVQTLVSPKQGPVFTLADFGYMPGTLKLHVDYAQPVPSWDWMSPTTTTTDDVLLCPCPEPQAGDVWQQRSFYDEVNDVSITTSFFWPPPPGFSAGYTAPLVCWDETVIEGYTTEPIVLRGYYSQTYHPHHHNFSEEFLFEPQLEPEISQDILDELRAKDIRMIHLFFSWPSSYITTYGFEAEPFYPADIDDDNDVDLVDFAAFAERWLDTICDACSGADLTGDGRVDMYDLRELAENWLAGF